MYQYTCDNEECGRTMTERRTMIAVIQTKTGPQRMCLPRALPQPWRTILDRSDTEPDPSYRSLIGCSEACLLALGAKHGQILNLPPRPGEEEVYETLRKLAETQPDALDAGIAKLDQDDRERLMFALARAS